MRISQELESRQYHTDSDLREGTTAFRVETNLTIDSDEESVDIDTYEYHGTDSFPATSYGVKFTLEEWTDLQEIGELLRRQLSEQDGRTRSVTIPVTSGRAYNSRLGTQTTEIEEIGFSIDERQIDVHVHGLLRGNLRHYQNLVDSEIQDRRNAAELLDSITELFDDSGPSHVLHLQHPDLRSEAGPEYTDGHYQSSVRTAFRVLEERIRDAGDYSQSDTGVSLAQDAFSPSGGPLSFSDVENERRGWMYLYAGGFSALRNPPSHRNTESIDQQCAMQILHYVDLLLDTLENEATEE